MLSEYISGVPFIKGVVEFPVGFKAEYPAIAQTTAVLTSQTTARPHFPAFPRTGHDIHLPRYNMITSYNALDYTWNM